MFIFSEDPPLKHKGHGLSVLLYNLFSGAEISITKWFTFLSHASLTRKDVQELPDLNIKLIGSKPVLSIRRYNKVNWLFNQVLFIIFLPAMIVALRRHRTVPVFIPIGASADPLYKIWLINVFTSNPVWLYVVDDLKSIARKRGAAFDRILCALLLDRCLRNASRVFGISHVLTNALSSTAKKKAETILPCFQKVDPIKQSDAALRNTYTYVFTGGLSFLYNDTLKLFADHLTRLQQETQNQFRLIIQTYSSQKDYDDLHLPDLVSYRTAEDRSQLYKTYQEADAFIIPYSFAAENRAMITTSFPQKIAQIIQLGLPLLIVGPRYGSVVDFFIKNKLNFVICEKSYDVFKQTVLEAKSEKDKAALIQRYIAIYDSNFSQKACIEKLKNHHADRIHS